MLLVDTYRGHRITVQELRPAPVKGKRVKMPSWRSAIAILATRYGLPAEPNQAERNYLAIKLETSLAYFDGFYRATKGLRPLTDEPDHLTGHRDGQLVKSTLSPVKHVYNSPGFESVNHAGIRVCRARYAGKRAEKRDE